MWPFGAKLALDIGLIIAGTGIAKMGKDKMMDDIYEMRDQMTEPEENIFEVNDFETYEF